MAEAVGQPAHAASRPPERSRWFRRITHERLVILLAGAIGVPATATALVLTWSADPPPLTGWLTTFGLIGFALTLPAVLYRHVVYPLRTVGNMLVALREGDFSIRARQAGRDGDPERDPAG